MQTWSLLRLFSLMVYLFMFTPVAVVVILSFNSSQFGGFPIEGFSLRWFATLAANEAVMGAFRTSLLLGVLTAIIATTTGILACLALIRYSVPGLQHAVDLAGAGARNGAGGRAFAVHALARSAAQLRHAADGPCPAGAALRRSGGAGAAHRHPQGVRGRGALARRQLGPDVLRDHLSAADAGDLRRPAVRVHDLVRQHHRDPVLAPSRHGDGADTDLRHAARQDRRLGRMADPHLVRGAADGSGSQQHPGHRRGVGEAARAPRAAVEVLGLAINPIDSHPFRDGAKVKLRLRARDCVVLPPQA